MFYNEFVHLRRPLPYISDEELRDTVFSRIYNAGPKDFDRLAWEGDVWWKFILYLFITATMRNVTNPNARFMEDLRNVLEHRYTQMIICICLGLHEEAMFYITALHPNLDADGRDRLLVKVYSDLFEAYIGALMHCDPLAGYLWLTEMIQILLDDLMLCLRFQLETWHAFGLTVQEVHFWLSWHQGPQLHMRRVHNAGNQYGTPAHRYLMERCFEATAPGHSSYFVGHPPASQLYPRFYS